MNRKDQRPSKIAYERYLNQLGVPENDRKSNGGRIPDYVKYGTWIRVNETEKFESGYEEFKAKARAAEKKK